jgi:Uma2 family endonuclease
MSAEHNHVLMTLARQLFRQLDETRFAVSINAGRVARADESHYIPDLYVIQAERVAAARKQAAPLEVYRDPVLLVVEVWSPSTGGYDVDDKLPEYIKRGDLEIWRLHPFERTLRGWRRRPDGGYDEFIMLHGMIQPTALPGIEVDLDLLFAPPA